MDVRKLYKTKWCSNTTWVQPMCEFVFQFVEKGFESEKTQNSVVHFGRNKVLILWINLVRLFYIHVMLTQTNAIVFLHMKYEFRPILSAEIRQHTCIKQSQINIR